MAHLSELFRSTEEQVSPVEATVTGHIPEWLKGNFVRLGPGKFDLGDFVMNHWFDGYAVLYKFNINNGKVTFSKRFLQSDAYKRAVAVGRPVFTEFGTKSFPDPCKNIFSRMMSSLLPDLTDNDAINVFTLEDAVFVATETNYLRRIDLSSLETMEKVDLTKLVGVNLASSHTYKDPSGEQYYSMGTSLMSGPKYHIIKTPTTPSGKAQDALKKAVILTTISSSWKTSMSYYHSFGMSENYIVFIEQPLVVSAVKLATSQVKGHSMRDCMNWSPEELNKFFVIEKSTGKILRAKYKSKEPFFLFHHINTYEENNQLVVDVVAFDSPDIIDKLYLKKIRNNELSSKDPGYGRRFVLPLPTEKDFPIGENLVTLKTTATAVKNGDIIQVTPQILSEPGYELPTVSRTVFGKKYRYYYACGLYDPGAFTNALLKVDVETGDVKTWKENEFTYPGEVQFVPCPGSASEDDGILLATVTDVRKGEPDFLLVLDAKSFTELARAEVTVHIPNVIHGIFLSNS